MSKEILAIEFELLVGEEKISADELLVEPGKLLDYYVSEEDATDSNYPGGFCISVGGKKWNGGEEFYFDMFSYTLNWLKGIEELLSNESIMVDVGFWEESVATAILKEENKLEILDKSVNGRIIAPSIIVNFESFCRQLLNESRKYESLALLVKQKILSKAKSIDLNRAHQIIREMCADEFRDHNRALEILIRKRFG